MNRIEKHVDRILEQMQSPPEEREDIKEELMSHLQTAKLHYMEDGVPEKKAEKQAIDDFGKPDTIGHGFQETIYPYQRSLLYGIGIATLIFGAILYISLTFGVGETEPLWLLIQMVVGSAVTLSAINIAFMGRHFWSVNVIVLLTAVWNFLNLVVVGSMPQAQAISFSLYLVTVIILCLIFVIRNSYYSSNLSETKPKERNIQKVSYVVNIIFFVLICAGALFFTWGLMFAGGFQWKLLLPLSSIVAWLIFYKFQMTLIVKRPVASVLVGLVFLVLALIAPFAIAIFLT